MSEYLCRQSYIGIRVIAEWNVRMIGRIAMTDVALPLNKVHIPRLHVQVCNVQSGQLLGKFPTSRVNKTALLPVLTEHSLATNLLLFGVDPQTECVPLMSILAICMLKFWAKQYTWHLYESRHTIPSPWLKNMGHETSHG